MQVVKHRIYSQALVNQKDVCFDLETLLKLHRIGTLFECRMSLATG